MENIKHLILLIGTNPLPNYVVSKYFLTKENSIKKIWLIYSEKIGNQNGTRDLAENIQKIFKKMTEVSIQFVSLADVSSAQKIESDIKDKLITQLEDGYVHLNYTGGTKAMSVHVYRTLEQELGSRCSFSYLDSRNYILKNDDGQFMTSDLRNEIEISLDDLIDLHGYEKAKSEDHPNWLEVIEEFENLIIEKKLRSEYFEWVNKFLNKVYFKDNDFIEKIGLFNKHNNLPDDVKRLNILFKEETSDNVLKLLQKIPTEHSIINDDGTLWIPTNKDTNKIYKNRLQSSVKNFLHGKWLEAYVSKILKRNLDELRKKKNTHIVLEENWEIRKTSASKLFEIDIIAMNGYQLCGISITTSDKEYICKNKGFEILHRTQQMGGGESKVILITCLPKEKVEEFTVDLLTISGSHKEKLLVLGEADLKPDRLWKKVEYHIWGS